MSQVKKGGQQAIFSWQPSGQKRPIAVPYTSLSRMLGVWFVDVVWLSCSLLSCRPHQVQGVAVV